MDELREKLVAFAQRNPVAGAVVNIVGRSRAEKLLNHFRDWLPPEGRILDIGAGSAHMAEAIHAAGHEVVPLDVADLRFVDLPLVLADGANLPFADLSFDATLLLTVLHHVPPGLHSQMLKEGVRVLRPGGRLLILEDTFINRIERAQTFILDAVLNAEFSGHVHANRTLVEWKQLIGLLGLSLAYACDFSVRYGIFRIRHGLIVIERT